MDASAYDRYVEEVRAKLFVDEQVKGLIAVGSTAVPENRDAWSDHDFWIITDSGIEYRYLDSVAWLPLADQILMSVRHSGSHRSVLLNNRHKVEYAVFDLAGLASNTLEQYRIIFDRGEVLQAAEAAVAGTRKERFEVLRLSFTLQGFGILVWSAYGRAARGELLSSRRFLELSTDVLLNLLCVYTGLGRVPGVDTLDPRRRLEQYRPKLAREILEIISGDIAAACPLLVDFAERELRGRSPDAGWDEIDQLRSWMVTFETTQ